MSARSQTGAVRRRLEDVLAGGGYTLIDAVTQNPWPLRALPGALA